MDNFYDENDGNAPLSPPNEATSGCQPAISASQNPPIAQPTQSFGQTFPSPAQQNGARPSGHNMAPLNNPNLAPHASPPQGPNPTFAFPNTFPTQGGYTGGNLIDLNGNYCFVMASSGQGPYRTQVDMWMNTEPPSGYLGFGAPLLPAAHGNQSIMPSNAPPGPNGNGRPPVGEYMVTSNPLSEGQLPGVGPGSSNPTNYSPYNPNLPGQPGSTFAPLVSGPTTASQNPGGPIVGPAPGIGSDAPRISFTPMPPAVGDSGNNNGAARGPEGYLHLPGDRLLSPEQVHDIRTKLAHSTSWRDLQEQYPTLCYGDHDAMRVALGKHGGFYSWKVEDDKLVKSGRKAGKSWSEIIEDLYRDRTETEVESRYYYLMSVKKGLGHLS